MGEIPLSIKYEIRLGNNGELTIADRYKLAEMLGNSIVDNLTQEEYEDNITGLPFVYFFKDTIPLYVLHIIPDNQTQLKDINTLREMLESIFLDIGAEFVYSQSSL